MAYTGSSIVDYLKSIGQDSSYSARSTLAAQKGITNYSGSGDQNLQLLNILKTPTPTPTPTATPTAVVPAPVVAPVVAPTLTSEQTSGLQAIYAELEKRGKAGTPANETLTGVPVEAPIAPTGTTNVANLNAPTVPNTTNTSSTATTTSNIPTTATATTEISDNIQKKIEEENKAYQAKLEADQKAESERLKASMGTSATGFEGLAEFAKTTPTVSTEEKLKLENEKAGITALQAKLSTQNAKIVAIQNEIAQDTATQQAEVEQARTRLSSMENISADINEINYKYNLQKAKKTALLGAEAAVATVYQGDLTSAQNMVADIVNAYTADKKSEVDKFENLYNVYSSWTSSLDTKELNILKNAHETAINDLKTAKTDATNVMNMMLQYPSAGILLTDSVSTATTKASNYQNTHKDESAVIKLQQENPGAGILPTDTVQTATAKAEKYQIAHKDEADVAKLQAQYLNAGITQSDTLQQALDKAAKYSKDNPKIETQIVGSADTGYSMVKYDSKGKVLGTTPILAGTGTSSNNIFSEVSQTEIDEGLTSEINNGADALQAATLYINGQTTTFTEKEKTAILNRAKEIKKSIDDVNKSTVVQDPNNPNASILKGYNPFITGLTNALFK